MNRLGFALAFLFVASLNAQQNWVRSEQTDAFSGVKYTQFMLAGRFLTPPRDASAQAPSMVLKCQAGRHRYGSGYLGGQALSSYITTGSVLDRNERGVAVMYRLDDGKAHQEPWSISTDGTAAFFTDVTLNTLIYGHFMPHKENTGAPIHKVVIAMDEAYAGEIVMQFDMPDPTEIADVCGIALQKR